MDKREKIQLAKNIWQDILDGLSYRKIATKYNTNASVVNFIANYTLPEMFNLNNLNIDNEKLIKENRELKIENQKLKEQLKNNILNDEEIKRLNAKISELKEELNRLKNPEPNPAYEYFQRLLEQRKKEVLREKIIKELKEKGEI